MQDSNIVRFPELKTDFIKAIRAKGAELNELLNEIELHLNQQHEHARATADIDEMQRLQDSGPYDWLLRAKFNLQSGLMFAERAVDQPITF